jgi:dephospho-CoA kinase
MPSKVILIGIIGGIASGKSYVADRLESLGAYCIHADVIGHELLENGNEIRSRIVKLFGQGVVNTEGKIDRKAIAHQVFGESDEATEKRRKLEAILHPAIRAESDRCLARLEKEGKACLAVLDAPLLVEAGWLPRCNEVIFVDTPIEKRRALAIQRGWSTDELARREANQLSVEEKQKKATIVLANNGTLEDLDFQVDSLYRSLISKYKF